MFAAITNGALFFLEHGFGKDTGLLVENWREVKPTVFFSVPKIYQVVLSSRNMKAGKTTAYVCQSYACKAPTTDPDDMLTSLR